MTEPRTLRASRRECAENLLDQARALLRSELEAAGVESTQAETIAGRAVRRLANSYGGSTLYFPRGTYGRREERNAEIRAAFDGRNYRDLALRFGLSEMMIRRILKTGQAAG